MSYENVVRCFQKRQTRALHECLNLFEHAHEGQVTKMSNGHRVKSQIVVAFCKRSEYVNGITDLSIISQFTIGQLRGIVSFSTNCIGHK